MTRPQLLAVDEKFIGSEQTDLILVLFCEPEKCRPLVEMDNLSSDCDHCVLTTVNLHADLVRGLHNIAVEVLGPMLTTTPQLFTMSTADTLVNSVQWSIVQCKVSVQLYNRGNEHNTTTGGDVAKNDFSDNI